MIVKILGRCRRGWVLGKEKELFFLRDRRGEMVGDNPGNSGVDWWVWGQVERTINILRGMGSIYLAKSELKACRGSL